MASHLAKAKRIDSPQYQNYSTNGSNGTGQGPTIVPLKRRGIRIATEIHTILIQTGYEIQSYLKDLFRAGRFCP